jgi:putative hydrolase of the HAD superfamily
LRRYECRSCECSALRAVAKLRASGVSVFLATDNEKYRTEYIRNDFGLGAHFDRLFSSAYVGFRKETPNFWKRVANAVTYEPAHILVLDDEQSNVDAARSVGFVTELFISMDDFNRKMEKYFPDLI